ncbi:MAG: hypothetical protein VKL42_15545 [Snowella sp.]|nr:hypothetical protein [Snowella sp.]
MSYSDKVIDIREINKKFSLLLPESGLRLVPKENSNGFLVGGNTSSQAINNYDNEPKEVNVFNLFNDFWIYIDINLIFDNSSRSNFPNIFVSISIFQGDGSDPIKNQLFRAEWDNYRDLKQEHPQPHWHIYPVQYHHKTFNDYLGLAEKVKKRQKCGLGKYKLKKQR